jgi:cell division protein FtsQ
MEAVVMGTGAAPSRGARAAGHRARRRRGRIGALRRPGPRLLAGLLGGLIILGGAYLWLRDSSLVGVEKVQIVGASGPEASQIRSALGAAARTMTTLDVKMRALQTAVAPYPVVKGIDVSTQFPHGMTIHVSEQVPVAVVQAGGRRIAVAGDGTLLHDLRGSLRLPVIALGVVPGGTRLTGYALSEARLLGAAPYPLLGRLSQVSDGPAHGLSGQLRSGPSLYFGAGSELSAKWAAVTEVLASSSSAGAQYIDVTDPARPAAGTGSDSASPGSASASSGASAGSGSVVTGSASASGAGTGTTAAGATGSTAPTGTTTTPTGP